MMAVVDACAIVRLFIPDGPLPDQFEPFMQGVERGDYLAVAPELLLAETTNVLLKKVHRGLLTHAQGREISSLIVSMPVRYFAHKDLMTPAFDLALSTRLTVYDALYVVLARRHNVPLFSADAYLCREAEQAGVQTFQPTPDP